MGSWRSDDCQGGGCGTAETTAVAAAPPRVLTSLSDLVSAVSTAEDCVFLCALVTLVTSNNYMCM